MEMIERKMSIARSLHHHSPHLHQDHNDDHHQHHQHHLHQANDDDHHQHHHNDEGQPAGNDLKFDLEKSGKESPMNRVIEHLPHLQTIITWSSSSSSLKRFS